MYLSSADTPTLQPFAALAVEVGKPIEVGRTPRGLRRMIPITGGEARGDGWTAKVLPGGADYQLVIGDTLAELQAHYVLQMDSGELVYVRNQAIRSAPADVTARLVRGEAVDPSLVYFRCHPSLETGAGKFAWVNERLFVGSGVRKPDRVEMKFFVLA
jgi:hypothetical protein